MLRRLGGRILLAAVLTVGLYGCAEEVEGPTPTISDGSAEAPAFEPGFTCNEQVDGWVTVRGSEFSPLVVDALADDGVELPTVTLSLSGTIEGDETTDTFETTLEASDIEDESRVRWLDDETMAFYVDEALGLPAGIYDVTVTNANEESATSEAAFGVLPRPEITAIVPDMACVAQGERSVEVQGDYFLVEDGQAPSVDIGGNTYEDAQPSNCRALADKAFSGAQACSSLTVTIPQDDFDPGLQEVTVNNAEPAACSSLPDEDEGNDLVIVAPPSVASVQPEPVCSQQLDYDSVSVTGQNFIKVTDADGNELMPEITVNGNTYTASTVADCAAIEGLSNETAESCTELTFQIAADDLQDAVGDGERSADAGLTVENPQPAGCTSTEDVALTVAPPPSVTDAQPEPVCVAQEQKQVTVTGFGFLDIGGELPQVQIGPNTYDADALASCTEITTANPADSFQSCDELTVTLPTAAVDPDMNHDIVVINPADAACESVEAVTYYVAGPPTVTNVTPQPICTADGDSVMTVEGTNFLEIVDDAGAANWPTVTVGANTYDVTNIGDCTDAPLQDDGLQRATRICTTLEMVIPQGDLGAGDYTVSVTNPLEANCESTETSDLNIVPPPTVASITEEIACVAQGQDTFTLAGSDFLVIDGIQPTVQVGSQTYTATADPTSCTSTTVNGRAVETCTTLSFDVPQGDLPAGVHQVTVVNPDSAACASSDTINLTINPPPTVAAVQPNPLCSATGGSVEVTGSDFLVIDGATPTATINGTDYTTSADTGADCVAVASVSSRSVFSCSKLTVDLPAADLVEGAHVVEVTNPDPAGCSSTDTTNLVALDPPTVASVTESIACNETADTSLTVSGTGFAKTAAGDLPTVTIGGQTVQTVSASGCSAVSGTAIETCTSLEVLASSGTLTTGANDIVVENAGGGGCASSEAVAVEIFGVAQVDSVQPALYCDQTGGTDLAVAGSNFFVVDGANPEVEIGGQRYMATPDTATCTTVNSRVESCTDLTVTVPEADLSPNTYQALVFNPAPLDCPSSSSATVVEAGAPTIASATPSPVCSNDTAFQGSGSVTLTGSSFLVIDGNNPTVTVNGQAAAVDSVSGCTSVPNPSLTVESCTDLTVTVPASVRDVDMNFELQNPAPADCGSPATFTLPITPAPQVTAVTPLRICVDGGQFQIDGENFDPGMTVDLGGTVADSVTVNADGTSAVAVFNSPPPTGDYDLTVTNPSTCSDTFQQQVKVVRGPQVFFADPPTIYDGITTNVIVYLSGLEGGSVNDVTITDSQGNSTSLDITFDPNRPNTVQAIVPAGTLPTGSTTETYDVTVTDDVNCAGTGRDLLTITSELTVAVDAIDPPFGYTASSTGVTITAEDPAPSGQTQFVATPRVYLNPVDATAGTVATELRATQFIDATELTGIVPSGLPVGEYDVIVVNPDGTVGLLTDPANDPTLGAFRVTQEPPPLIDTVSPGSWPTGEAALPVTVEGANFRDPTVETFCLDPSGNTDTAVITRQSYTDTTIEVTVDTGPLDHLSVCYMVVTNATDGTFAEFSPITVFNPAGNFVDFQQGPTLTTARRDPAMSSGEPSRRAKFIYAFGGDDGASANALTSMEAAQLDRFGAPRAWFELPQPYNLTVPQNVLPSGLTHAEATRIADFIYLVGGWDAATGAPSDQVLRANVLDPLDVPNITNLELTFAEAITGNDPGVYYYRVSAVLDNGAVHNPGGETLPSEVQPVRIPFRALAVDLTWASFPNAVEYRVYRTETPDQAAGTEELLAIVPAPAGGGPVTYVDDGSDSVTQDVSPLPLGSLGTWHQVTDAGGNPVALNQARYHHGVTSAPDPDTADQHFVYATAGLDASAPRSDYEYFAVTVNGPRDQVVSAVTQDMANPLSEARSHAPAVAATPATVQGVTDSYVYVPGGRLANGSKTATNEAARVSGNGALEAWTSVRNVQRSGRAAHAAAIANSTLVVAAGDDGSTNTTSDSVEICDGSGCPYPELYNWDSLAQVNLRERTLPGYVSFTGFFYLTGGYSLTTGLTLDTTDFSVMGGSP